MDGRDRFDRAMDFAREWKVGSEGKNNGVVMYFAMDERKIHILAADATQDVLLDGTIGSIIRDYITPNFKQGLYYNGIDEGINQIQASLEGRFVNDIQPEGKFPAGLIILIIIVFLFIIFSSKGNNRGGGYHHGGTYWFPTGGGGGSSWSGGGGGGWGGFGGGGGFNGGGAGGGW